MNKLLLLACLSIVILSMGCARHASQEYVEALEAACSRSSDCRSEMQQLPPKGERGGWSWKAYAEAVAHQRGSYYSPDNATKRQLDDIERRQRNIQNMIYYGFPPSP